MAAKLRRDAIRLFGFPVKWGRPHNSVSPHERLCSFMWGEFLKSAFGKFKSKFPETPLMTWSAVGYGYWSLFAENSPRKTRSAILHRESFPESPVRSSHESLFAKYRYLNRRFSLVKVCTQDRNRCSPSKLILPSAAISSSFLFPRA